MARSIYYTNHYKGGEWVFQFLLTLLSNREKPRGGGHGRKPNIKFTEELEK